MDIDREKSAQLEELRKQLDKVAGRELDLNLERLINFTFPIASHDVSNGQVTFQHIFFPGKSCSERNLLDVAGTSSTAADGKRVLKLTDFICSTINSFTSPVNVLATPRAETPCYATTTAILVPNPAVPGAFNDVQLTLFTWNRNGAPAPNVSVDWRCRLVTLPIIL
jgi:hypothetical protein